MADELHHLSDIGENAAAQAYIGCLEHEARCKAEHRKTNAACIAASNASSKARDALGALVIDGPRAVITVVHGNDTHHLLIARKPSGYEGHTVEVVRKAGL